MSKPHFQPTVGIHDNRLEAMYRCSQIQPCAGSAPTTCWPHAVYLQARLEARQRFSSAQICTDGLEAMRFQMLAPCSSIAGLVQSNGDLW